MPSPHDDGIRWRSIYMGPTPEPPTRPPLECELYAGAVRCAICWRLVDRGLERCELHAGDRLPWPSEIVG